MPYQTKMDKHLNFFISCLSDEIKEKYKDVFSESNYTVKSIAYLVKKYNPEKYNKWVEDTMMSTLRSIDDSKLTDLVISQLVSKLHYFSEVEKTGLGNIKEFTGVEWRELTHNDFYNKLITKIPNLPRSRIHLIKESFDNVGLDYVYPNIACENGVLLLNKYLPTWRKNTHFHYPWKFKKGVKTWLMICKRMGKSKISKDICFYIVKILAKMYNTDTDITFRPAVPEDYIDSNKLIYYERNWDDPEVVTVQKYLDQIIPNKNKQNYLLKILASGLNYKTRKSSEKYPIQIIGSGGNSKSMFMDLVESVYESYYVRIPPDTWSGQQVGRNVTHNKKLIISPEFSKGEKIKTYILDRMCKLSQIIFVNNETVDYDFPTNIIYFRSRWTRDVTEVSEKNHIYKQDRGFSYKIEKMAPAFLWILVQKYKEYINEGLVVPEIVTKDTDEWIEKCNNVHGYVKDFIANKMDDDNNFMSYEDYCVWCKNNNLETTRISYFNEKVDDIIKKRLNHK